MPTVSVIVPTYNRPDYLKRTLDSLNGQIYRDFEVIVVDDGTPGEALKELCGKYKQVRYFKISNSGSPIVPRNYGLKQARGHYIAFLDDDDLWMSNKLLKQVEVLENHPDYGLVHCYCKIINENDEATGQITGQLHADKKHGYVFDNMVGNFTVMLSTPLIRKEVLDLAGGFNESMPAAGEDVEFFYRLAFYTRFFFLNEALVKYRVHEHGLSKNNKDYIHLPWHLFNVVNGFYKKGLLKKKRYHVLRNKLLLTQIREASSWDTFLMALNHCLKMYPLFVFSPGVLRKIASKKMELLRAK